jgi:hypothetical protein
MQPLKSILQAPRGIDGQTKKSELRWVDQQTEEASEFTTNYPLTSTIVFREDFPARAVSALSGEYDHYNEGSSPTSLVDKASEVGATPATENSKEATSPDSPIVSKSTRYPPGARMQPLPRRISPPAPPTPTKTRSVQGGSILFENASDVLLTRTFVSSTLSTSIDLPAPPVPQLSKRQQAAYNAAHALYNQEQAHITAAPGKLILSSSTQGRASQTSRIQPSSSLFPPIQTRQRGATMPKELQDTLSMVLKSEQEAKNPQGKTKSKKQMNSSLQQPLSPPRSPLAPRSAPISPQHVRTQSAIANVVDSAHEMEMEMDEDEEEDEVGTESQIISSSAVLHTPASATASASSSYVTSVLKNAVASAFGLAKNPIFTSDAVKVLTLPTETTSQTLPLPELVSSPWGVVDAEAVIDKQPFERRSSRKPSSLPIQSLLLLPQLENDDEEKVEGKVSLPNVPDDDLIDQASPFVSAIVNELYALTSSVPLSSFSIDDVEGSSVVRDSLGDDVLLHLPELSKVQDATNLKGFVSLIQAIEEIKDDSNVNKNEKEEEEEEVNSKPVKVSTSRTVRVTRSDEKATLTAVEVKKSRKRPLLPQALPPPLPPIEEIKSRKRLQPGTTKQQAALKRTRSETAAVDAVSIAELKDDKVVGIHEPVNSAHYLELQVGLDKQLAHSALLRKQPIQPAPIMKHKQPGFRAIHSNPRGLVGDTLALKRQSNISAKRNTSDTDSEIEGSVDVRPWSHEFQEGDFSSVLEDLKISKSTDYKRSIEMFIINESDFKALKKGELVKVPRSKEESSSSSNRIVTLPRQEDAYVGTFSDGQHYCSRYPICNPDARTTSSDRVFGSSSLQELKKPKISVDDDKMLADEEVVDEGIDETVKHVKPSKMLKKKPVKPTKEEEKSSVVTNILSLGLRLTIADARKKKEEEGKKVLPVATNTELNFKGSRSEDGKKAQVERKVTRSSVPPLAGISGKIIDKTKKSLLNIFEAADKDT